MKYLFLLTLNLIPNSLAHNMPEKNLDLIFEVNARAYNVPVAIIKGIAKVESRFNPHAINYMDGRTPSYGIMQMKYRTAKFMGFKGTVKELKTPERNIQVATKYLAYQYERYNNWDKAIVAYNRGSYKTRTKYLYLVKFAMAGK